MFAKEKWVLGIFLIFLFISVSVHSNAENKGVDAYLEGDYRTALSELKPLAERGDANSQNLLGIMYSKGQGVPPSYTEAVKWFRLSAEQGNSAGQYNLGEMYYDGTGVAQSYKEAFRWYLFAAEAGLAIAQNTLGVMYAKGQAVPQNQTVALKWFILAAQGGNGSAIKNKALAKEIMSPEQLAEAENLARKWLEEHK